MVEFRYIPPDEAAARHAPRTTVAPPRQQRTPEHRNVRQVLDLGDVRYISFQGSVYRVPAVPFKLGHRVLEAQVRVQTASKSVQLLGDKKSMEEFFAGVEVLAKLLWKHIRPASRVQRALWRLGLLRNPLRKATEADLSALTDFFLQGRTMSSVQSTSGTGRN